ncbi:serine/threonine-protein kinase [Thermomonospora amylolytica]|uniref:serine/threonine-protein kinase n=1 Tax=Thermomonospora amylolytica TaxID=1411117 RepID=UPI000E6B64BB|nr:serine/threonine-protein kinase [Thermomonospora amylolytica]
MGDWRIDGFQEVRELGKGAQGRVVLARHVESGTPVAIKYVQAEDTDELRREAMLLGRVTDPHVARLYRLVQGERGAAIVMEAVNGVSLKRVLAEHGTLGPEAALVVLKGSLLGLAAAHAVGIVHRDYKPANVMVQADGLSKLIDFGIAAPAGAGSRSGTPAYMAPEQWTGGSAAPATDVYAATCVFFECVTGRRPYPGTGLEELRALHTGAPVPLEEMPRPLRNLVARGMAKDPAQRPPGAAAFVTELDTIAVAEYGPDWEDRGIRTLAGAAVALASLFPLAALGIAPALAAAPAAGGAAAGTAAGGMVGGTAGAPGMAAAGGGGLFAGAGAKVALAVAGTAVVAGAGGIVVANVSQEPPAPPARPVSALVATQNQTYTDVPLQVRNARYAQISGLGDAQVQRRLNQALRQPLDWWITWMRDNTGRNRDLCTGSSLVESDVRIGLRGPTLVSVRYDITGDLCYPADGTLPSWAVTVNVKTGRVLTATDVFRPETLTDRGVTTLWNRLTATEGIFEPGGCSTLPVDRDDFFPSRQPDGPNGEFPPYATVFFAPDRFEINWSTGGSDCVRDLLYAPYDKVRDLLKPEIVAALPGTSPAPRRS